MLAADDESASAKVGAVGAGGFHGGKTCSSFYRVVFDDESMTLELIRKLKTNNPFLLFVSI